MKIKFKQTKRYYKFLGAAVIVILFANLFATAYATNRAGTANIKSSPSSKVSSSPKRTPAPRISPSITPSPTMTPSPTNPPSTWVFSLEPGKELELNSTDLKWVFLNGQLYVITIENGQIAVFEQDDKGNWSEFQRFGPEDTVLTTFKINDVNGDNMPEIIAGTVDPGFISIYKFIEGKWVLNNFERYVWSSITNIAIGNFDGSSKGLLVQNQEGFFFLLKISSNSLDLIWKSPIAWKPISSFTVLDINQDQKDEIIASYKTGGIGVLKLDNNQIVSVWENYVWGKMLATAKGDWDNDNQSEFIFSTSQKLLYILGFDAKKGYQFESQLSQLNYTVERLFFRNYRGVNQLVLTDTSGKLHMLDFNSASKLWTEDFWCNTGRIVEIIVKSENDPILLLGQNHRTINLRAFPAKDLKLLYLDRKYDLNPAPVFQNTHLYVSPAFLGAIPDLGIKYSNNKKGVTEIHAGEMVIVLSKKDLSSFKVNNETQANTDQFLFVGDNLYLMSEFYQKLLNLAFEIDPANKTLVLTVPAKEKDDTENSPAGDNTENPPAGQSNENIPAATFDPGNGA